MKFSCIFLSNFSFESSCFFRFFSYIGASRSREKRHQNEHRIAEKRKASKEVSGNRKKSTSKGASCSRIERVKKENFNRWENERFDETNKRNKQNGKERFQLSILSTNRSIRANGRISDHQASWWYSNPSRSTVRVSHRQFQSSNSFCLFSFHVVCQKASDWAIRHCTHIARYLVHLVNIWGNESTVG